MQVNYFLVLKSIFYFDEISGFGLNKIDHTSIKQAWTQIKYIGFKFSKSNKKIWVFGSKYSDFWYDANMLELS